MATLYEIDERLANIFVTPEGTAVDGSTGEVLDTKVLDDLEMEKWSKVDNICRYIKNLQSDIEQYKEEVDKLTARAVSAQKKLESLKTYLFKSMQALGRQKIDMPRAVMSLKKNAPSLVIDDEISFVEWAEEHNLDHLLKYSMPEVKKNDVKALCKKGEEIPFVHMEAKQSLSIK